ncbi:hypothetical protein CRUP_011392 [Coryphaenoides rupestris]|nr:hypothetical protein CRUP_011392 [Coryphaenoides rupestris]
MTSSMKHGELRVGVVGETGRTRSSPRKYSTPPTNTRPCLPTPGTAAKAQAVWALNAKQTPLGSWVLAGVYGRPTTPHSSEQKHDIDLRPPTGWRAVRKTTSEINPTEPRRLPGLASAPYSAGPNIQ